MIVLFPLLDRSGETARRVGLVACLLACTVGSSCTGQAGPATAALTATTTTPLSAAPAHASTERVHLPADRTRFAPAQAQLSGEGHVTGEQIADIDSCEGCHVDVYDQLWTSAHAFSSFNNPLYRTTIDGFRERVGKEQSQMCGGCHDIALLVDDAMLAEVQPDDDRAHAGITCRVCHGIESASIDGNGSWTLSQTPLPIPKRSDPSTVAPHVAAVQPLDDDRLCATCHRSFLSPATGNGHFLSGMDDFGAWRGSAYNKNGAGRIDDPVAQKRCRDCHMAREPAVLGDAAVGDDGKVASHRFLGGHTWLAAMRGDDAQLERLREFLRDTVSVDIATAQVGDGPVQRPADAAEVAPGQEIRFDLTVRNVGVGHAFPGGVKDAVDSWLALEVRDARGVLVAESRDDDSAHRFRVLVGNARGEPQLVRNTEDFYEAVVDHTIAARDARVIRYGFRVPAELSPQRFPLQVTAKLLHRSRNLEFQARVCDESRSARSRAFAEAQRDRIDYTLDPCVEQPVSVVGEASTWIGRGAERRLEDAGQSGVELARRLYEHGLGLLAELPREADRARGSLLAAREALATAGPEAQTPLRRAQIASALGAVYAGAPCGPSAPPGWPSCAGRLQEALRFLEGAERDAPGHPAIAAVRARAYKRRFMWGEAAAELERVTAAVPQNPGVARALATTLSGLGRHRRALEVARRGLSLVPRDDDLLRVQARALFELGAPPAVVAAADAAYQAHRRADRPTAMRALCIASDPRCQTERLAVHTHWLGEGAPAPANHAHVARR